MGNKLVAEKQEEEGANLALSEQEKEQKEQLRAQRMNLDGIFRKNGKVYNGSAEMVIDLFLLASRKGNEETMKALIFPGSPVLTAEVVDNNNFLHLLSCYKPNLVIAQLLIDSGVDVNKQNCNGSTALILAAEYCKEIKGHGDFSMIPLLLKNGANRDIRNKYKITSLQLCLFYQQLEIAEEFFPEDKLPNVAEVDRTKRRRHLANCILRGNDSTVIPSTNYSMLLHFLINENDDETFEYVMNNSQFDVNAVGLKKFTLLHLAAKKGTVQMVRALIKNGADPDALTRESETPLIVAITREQTEIFHSLLDGGASVSKFKDCDLDTNYPLHYAVCMQNLEMVETLVKLGADVNALTYHRSPLLLACGSVHSEKWPEVSTELKFLFYRNLSHFLDVDVKSIIKIVEFLLDRGADIEAKNASNGSVLDQACRFGNVEIVKLLLNRGAKINQGDVSTLHYAVKGKNPAIVKLILQLGADVNYRCAPEKMLRETRNYVSPPPRTPLECALDFIRQDPNCKDIIEILMEYRVNVNVAEAVRRETPLHLAYFSHREVYFATMEPRSRPATIRFLLRHNADANALDAEGFVPLHYALRYYNYLKNYEDSDEDTDEAHCVFKHTDSFSVLEDLKTLIAFLAKMIAKNEWVTEENLILLEDKFVRPIYEECVNELSLMKKNICESRNLSYFNILSKDVQNLGSALKDKDIFEILNGDDYKKQFPIYAGYIEDRIREATIRQPRVDLTIVLFQKYVNKDLLLELILNILKFFNLDDFKNFANACFVDEE